MRFYSQHAKKVWNLFGIRNRGSIKEGTLVYPIKTSATGPRNCILMSLGGNPTKQAAKRTTPFPSGFMHQQTGTIIEIDEFLHFTSFRLQSFEHYPTGSPSGRTQRIPSDLPPVRSDCGQVQTVEDGCSFWPWWSTEAARLL